MLTTLVIRADLCEPLLTDSRTAFPAAPMNSNELAALYGLPSMMGLPLSGPSGQPPRLAELDVGSCRSGTISARLPIQPKGSTWAKLRTGVSSPKSSQAGHSCEGEGGP